MLVSKYLILGARTGSWRGSAGFLAVFSILIVGCSTSEEPTDLNAMGTSGTSGSSTYQTTAGNASLGSGGQTTGGSSLAAGAADAGKSGGNSGAGGSKAGVSGTGNGGSRSTAGTGGNTQASGGTGGSTVTSSCSSVTLNKSPFGCNLAWGTNQPDGSIAGYGFLQFITKWVDWQMKADGTVPSCDGCNWLTGYVAGTNLIPVYYAYFIGYFGHANGLQDQNVNPNGPNLATGGAELIRNNRSKVINMYSSYAKSTYQVWKNKPLVWLLEGDFIQYGDTGQKNPLSYAELAQLTADIACAIKTNMPNAVVAINHTTWNGDDETNSFWGAMKSAGVAYDLVWTTGVPNNNGFIDASTKADSYNRATATYAYVNQLTERPILVDTSFGLSGQGDTWSTSTAATLNQRIAEGVMAVNVGELKQNPSQYESAIKALAPQLNPVCGNK